MSGWRKLLTITVPALVVAALALAAVWAKWRFDPRRLPVLPFVPFVLAISLIEGHIRAARLRHR